MPRLDLESVAFERQVDATLAAWRQGDCVVEPQWFVYRADGRNPLTAESIEASEALAGRGEEIDDLDDLTVESSVAGFAVVTQTCDLVRTCTERAYVEVCPLVEVDEDTLLDITRGRRPGYAYVPAVAGQLLVIDLDRVMTVEKSTVARWTRVPGCVTDDDARRLSLALARKRARTAFPDDFVAAVKRLTDRLKKKHEKESAEGAFLRALREIRVSATPSWDAQQAELHFYFVLEDTPSASVEKQWAALVLSLVALVDANDKFLPPMSSLVSLDDMTARDYVDSDVLDLDHLSHRPSAANAQRAANGNNSSGE